MKLKLFWIYLDIAKRILKLGNWFYMKHVQALRKSQQSDGIRRL